MAAPRLSRSGERAVSELISRYELHSERHLPVPIRQVVRDLGWTVVYSERMGRLYGIAVVYQDVQLMQINAHVSHAHQRMAMAHELGHVLNGDDNILYLCAAGGPLSSWTTRRIERQASLAAARILIPPWALREFGTIDEVAAACEVPVELVELFVGRS